MSCPGSGEPLAMAARRKYPDERRDRGVRLVFKSGRPVAHVARDLGVHRETLWLWVREAEAEADAGTRNDRLTTTERERLKELECEVRELRRVNEILKAASAFSRRSSTRPGRSGDLHRRPPRPLRGRADCRTLGLAPSTY
jgi:transposase